MGLFMAQVRPRWSDMDVYGHVNHANTVTLLEEARIALLFGEAARHAGAEGIARGVVVARIVVDYHAPLVADGGSVRIALSVREMRHASFTMDYEVHSGPSEDDPVAVTAETMLVPYDLANGRPRRMSDAEKDFLAAWRSGSNCA
ncbi:acyl-CoA thioesterase [Actinophytocola gossypii]|uniref:Acyl-CoA thioesterase n=1 Tax=Actinophytocola gossypii TaxID=2812003 RepID=A0ABT2JG93_9PSEU|nr:thioesterase family protein [Actinophytocola gossypii]MCT2586873.1 acyl-CoA thioesterase [Actinophytocola gossypii]